MQYRFLNSINDISHDHWNSITGIDYPFIRHEFLAALENSGAATQTTGWQAQHLCVYEQQQLIAVMPLYLKTHSYGEYVFDWAWADAYQRHGFNYYPKLISAIPFTPATGPRLCFAEGKKNTLRIEAISEQLIAHSKILDCSSIHILFSEQTASQDWPRSEFMTRTGVQFHWFNEGYTDFADFLNRFSSRKRKNVNKERRTVSEQAITIEQLSGADISSKLWETFYQFYQATYLKRSGHAGYLNLHFFQQLAKTMPEQLVLMMAKKEGQYIAGALNFRDSKTLYGRYWGCLEEVEQLHFETCYYQGIDYCIKNKLKRFDPGAQGEHKIARGFTPVKTLSNHWISHPDFSKAIFNFLQQEDTTIEKYQLDCMQSLPFKETQS